MGAHRKGILEELEKAHIYIEQLHKRLREMEKLRFEDLERLQQQLSDLETKLSQHKYQ